MLFKSNDNIFVIENKIDSNIIEYDKKKRVTNFTEKPEFPKTNHISLGMYLVNRDYLLEILNMADTLVDFGRDLIPYLVNRKDDIYVHEYSDIFMDVGTVKSLYDSNMFFLENPDLIKNKGDRFKFYTKPYNLPPEYITNTAKITSSLISDGSVISGKIVHSIISINTYIEKSVEVIDSVILPNVKILKGIKLVITKFKN